MPPVLEPIGTRTTDEGQSLIFTISATDPDGDSLVYSASNLPTGADFDPQTQQFSWTPSSDQAGTYYVTFTVSDGQYQDYELVTIMVQSSGCEYLLCEDFDDGDYIGWTIINEGNRDVPSDWSASTGEMVQSSNIYSLPVAIAKAGTYALWDDLAAFSWTDYRITLAMKSEDDDTIGVMFRYQDENNYYRFSWDRQREYC